LLISLLDNKGFLIEKYQKILDEYINDKKINKIKFKKYLDITLNLIKSFEPQGCASIDEFDCLLSQAQFDKDCPKLLINILKNYTYFLKRNEIKKIAQLINISENKINNLLKYLKKYNLYPGLNYDNTSNNYINPEVEINIINNNISIKMFYEDIPFIYINNIDKNINNNEYQEAQTFIYNIEYIFSTFKKIIFSIINKQKDYFFYGLKNLKPLTLQEISEDTNINISTVSRLIKNRYIKTPFGIKKIKFLFVNALNSVNDNKHFNKYYIKDLIYSLIINNNKISDNKIRDILLRKNIKIVRRTITKYRMELKIPSSYQRK